MVDRLEMLSQASSTPALLLSPSDHMSVSPATRRRVGLTASSRPQLLSPVAMVHRVRGGGAGVLRGGGLGEMENDDEAEKRERRRSKVLTLTQKHLSSPMGTGGITPATDRRKSMPLSGLSNAQVSEHYSNCIKLSTENKINSKNAFGLHLIDYMADLLKKKELSNFQVASSTLDASAKIYAGRVDAIHTETYKVLSGLGRGAGGEREDGDAAGGGADGGDEDSEGRPVGGKAKRKTKRGKTIERNLGNLNVAKFDLEYAVDPMFQKMCNFNDGGTGGLLLSQLRTREDNSCQLLLDAQQVAPPAANDTSAVGDSVGLNEMKEICTQVNYESLRVCPAFEEFVFTSWDPKSKGFLPSEECGGEHAFDPDQEVEAPPDLDLGGGALSAGDVGEECGYGAGDDDDDCVSDAGGGSGDLGPINCSSKQAQLANQTMLAVRDGSLSKLTAVLSDMPSDYSYFNSNLLSAWAGPKHWKLKAAVSKAPHGPDSGPSTQRKKKPLFRLSYDDPDVDFGPYFKRTRASTVVSKATILKYNKDNTTLPQDFHYDTHQLFKLFLKPAVMVRLLSKDNGGQEVDGAAGEGQYDYGNQADVANFCPGTEGDDDDDDGGFGDNDDDEGQSGFNLTAGDDRSILGATQLNYTFDGADNLVEQPRKVERIHIDYARTAKKVDVKKLKSTLWSIIMATEPQETAPTDPADPPSKHPAAAMEEDMEELVNGETKFSEVLLSLPGRVSSTMAKNLSVPMAFACLLHLANEKCLMLRGNDNLSDIIITSGLEG